jgi:calcium-dependent protein kinase
MSTIKTIMHNLLKAVNVLHDTGVIHRDLKPDNIMFMESDNFDSLKIIDFGLATEMSATQYLFPKCGTPGYVAPEILNLVDRTIKYSSQCDIFSCGCIFYKLYEILTYLNITLD